MLLFVSPSVCSPRGHLQAIVILFRLIYPFSLFVIFFLFPYHISKLFCFLCIRLLISPCAFPTDLLVEFLSLFGKSWIICIVWPYIGIFWVSLLSPISFDGILPVVLPDLSAIVYFLFLFFFCRFILLCPCVFSFLSSFHISFLSPRQKIIIIVIIYSFESFSQQR